MSDAAPAPSTVLLACFADFYEEVASIKRAHGEGRLAAYLAIDGEPAPVDESEFAARVSARLYNIARQQTQDFQRRAGVAEIKAHQTALYLMVALADEIFLLEFDWPGSDAWMNLPLEQRLFDTCRAGQGFFDLADHLIDAQGSNPLHVDLASVFLLALQLGFKGEHRGRGGQETLRTYRQQLFHVANINNRKRMTGNQNGLRGDAETTCRHAFFQAYQQRIVDGKDERLAPLSPWRALAKFAAISYVALSTLIWWITLYPLDRIFGA